MLLNIITAGILLSSVHVFAQASKPTQLQINDKIYYQSLRSDVASGTVTAFSGGWGVHKTPNSSVHVCTLTIHTNKDKPGLVFSLQVLEYLKFEDHVTKIGPGRTTQLALLPLTSLNPEEIKLSNGMINQINFDNKLIGQMSYSIKPGESYGTLTSVVNSQVSNSIPLLPPISSVETTVVEVQVTPDLKYMGSIKVKFSEKTPSFFEKYALDMTKVKNWSVEDQGSAVCSDFILEHAY